MNTKENKRHQETLRRIYTTFGALLREQELNKISVTTVLGIEPYLLLEFPPEP